MDDESGDVRDVFKNFAVAMTYLNEDGITPKTELKDGMEKMDEKCYVMLGNEINVPRIPL